MTMHSETRERPCYMLGAAPGEDRLLPQIVAALNARVSLLRTHNVDETRKLMSELDPMAHLCVVVLALDDDANREILNHLRSNPELCHTPAVWATTRTQEALIPTAREGVNATVLIPESEEELEALAQDLIRFWTNQNLLPQSVSGRR